MSNGQSFCFCIRECNKNKGKQYIFLNNIRCWNFWLGFEFVVLLQR